MIFYFSATGNNKYAAECIAADGEHLISITGVRITISLHSFSDIRCIPFPIQKLPEGPV